MAQLNLNTSEFCDIIICYLLDAMYNNEIGANNQEFRDMIDNMESKGLKPILLQKFLGMNQSTRFDYKRIKNVFNGKQKMGSIIVNYEKEIPEDKEKIMPKLFSIASGAIIDKLLVSKPSSNGAIPMFRKPKK